jgi:hypothetical protein
MNRIPFGRTFPDPSCTNIFIDSCAFDPNYEPETTAANYLKSLYESGKINLLIAHSTAKELEHPNVPTLIKREAQGRIRSFEVTLTEGEIRLKQRILETLTGNGKPENMLQDAEHIFEAQKYGSYFVTVHKGILRKADGFEKLCGGLIVLLPSAFLSLLEGYT